MISTPRYAARPRESSCPHVPISQIHLWFLLFPRPLSLVIIAFANRNVLLVQVLRSMVLPERLTSFCLEEIQTVRTNATVVTGRLQIQQSICSSERSSEVSNRTIALELSRVASIFWHSRAFAGFILTTYNTHLIHPIPAQDAT
jgi:hypothetical protein